MSGFVYIWRDKNHNRYYIGSHWGPEDDGYVCSSQWMKRSFLRRPNDFKRRILSKISSNRLDLLKEEQRWLDLIKPEEIKVRYYNLMLRAPKHWYHTEHIRLTIGEKISKAKKGTNTGPRDPSIGQKISEVKKKKFAERREKNGSAFTEEHKRAIAEAQSGKVQSEESNSKRSETLRTKYESGELKANGRPHTEESKRKLSEKLTGRKLSDETKTRQSIAQSKQYLVTFFDGSQQITNGLKTFCSESGIPYVTARKAFESGGAIKKYKVSAINIYNEEHLP